MPLHHNKPSAGIGKRILELETVPWTPNVKSVNSPFKEIVSSLVFAGEVSEDLHWTQEREVLRLCQFQRHR